MSFIKPTFVMKKPTLTITTTVTPITAQISTIPYFTGIVTSDQHPIRLPVIDNMMDSDTTFNVPVPLSSVVQNNGYVDTITSNYTNYYRFFDFNNVFLFAISEEEFQLLAPTTQMPSTLTPTVYIQGQFYLKSWM